MDKALLWIDGKRRPAESGKTFESLNPATGKALAAVAEGGVADVDAACRAAQSAMDGVWGKTNPRQRARILFNAARVIRDHVDELAGIECRDAGKPMADARDEAGLVADVIEYYAGAVSKHFGETIPVHNPGLELTLKEPVGVCGLIVPWNFPAVIASWKLGPALACGNAVVLKPAELTPLSALKLAEYFAEAGLPDGVLNVVPGPGVGCGDALVAHPLVRKVSFTGSTKVGKEIMRSAADRIKRVSLELGGKSANIVFDDPGDLDFCVEKSLWSVFGNAGQDCCARSRFLVHRKIYDKFAAKIAARAKRFVVGDPLKKGVDIGPLISCAQRERVSSYVEIGEGEGAKRVCGGTALKGPGFFLTPAVFERVESRMRIFKEEIFGPVVCLTPFSTEEEAIALANDSDYGLSGTIWTRDLGRALRVAKAVKTGVLSVNATTSVYTESPFGGYKQSGLGRELGMKALDLYSEVKSVFLSAN